MNWSCAALQEMKICPLADGTGGGLCWPESSRYCGEYSAVRVM